MREYMEKLRAAPVEQVVTDVIAALLNAAQVKLGRRDARLLIDLSAAVVDHSRNHVSGELASQIDQTLGQLRLGQVQAESAPATGDPEPNDLTAPVTPPAGAPAGSPSAAPQQQTPASKLWLPGHG